MTDTKPIIISEQCRIKSHVHMPGVEQVVGFLERNNITTHEIVLFVVLCLLFLLVGLFFNYSIIQKRVQKESMCFKERELADATGMYTANARVMNRPAFDITYDALDKSSKITCACADGDVQTTFKAIPYYDLNRSTPSNKRLRYMEKLVCNCESDISAAASDQNVSYVGEQGIVKFMYDQKNTGFFDTIIYGANQEYVS